MTLAVFKNPLSIRQPLRGLLPLAVGLLSFTMAAPVMAQDVQNQTAQTITVSGRSSENIPTSIAQVRLGVEAQGETAVEVQEQVAQQSAAVVELLRSRNVDKLQTTGVNLYPTYDYSNNRQEIIGYTASNTVSFEVPTDQSGPLLDAAVNAGATRIDGISFIATEEAIASARQVALREAAQNAREQANTVLAALGLTPDDIVSIQVSDNSVPPPIIYEARNMQYAADAAAPSTPVIAGEQQVEAYITLQISFEQ